jgi:PAS domain S-box-containing protein
MVESTPRILIVDDDKDFADSLHDLLESRSIGCHVAYTAEQALKLTQNKDVDIALLDIRLGSVSGIELIQDIHKINPEILCIIMTAYAAVETAIEALQEGAYDYLRKPLNSSVLLATINRCYEKLVLKKEKESAQASLKRSEEKYRNLIETMKEGVVILDANGIINYANERFSSFIKLSDDEIKGLPLTEFLDAANRDSFIQHSGSDGQDELSSYELTFRCKDGSRIPTIISPRKIIDEKGKFTGSFAVITDISHQKIVEEYMRVQRDLGLALSGSIELKESLKEILDAVLKISGMDNGSIFLVNDETGGMDLAHYEGVSTDFAGVYACLEPDNWFVKMMREGQTQSITHEEIGFQVENAARQESLRSFMSIPITYEDKFIAALNVGSHYLDEFPKDMIPIVEAIALQIGEVLNRIKTEESIIRERATLDNVISLNPYGIIVFDSEGCFVRTNKAFQNIFGFILHDDYHLFKDLFISKTEFSDKIKKIMIGEVVRVDNIYLNPRDISNDYPDREICLSTTFFPIYSAGGGVENIVVMVEDITERMKTQEALSESEERFKAIVEGANDAIFIKDNSFKHTFVNPQMERLFNINAHDLIGKTDFELFSEEDATNIRRNDERALKGEVVETEESKTISNVEYSFHIVKVPMRDADGNIVGLCGIARDITDRKQSEIQLLEYQKQLQSLASQLSISEERERRRIATELHDRISQSLAFSKLQLGLLGKEVEDTGVVDKIKEISDLIDGTIRETRSLTFEICPPILYELGFEAAVEWLAEDFNQRHGLKINVINDDVSKPLDENLRGLLFQSVRELLMNVVKHAGAQNVQISIKAENGFIEIDVADDGIGFDSEKLTNRNHEDAGFGLFSIRERMNHFGGQLSINTDHKDGARLVLVAPLRT